MFNVADSKRARSPGAGSSGSAKDLMSRTCVLFQ